MKKNVQMTKNKPKITQNKIKKVSLEKKFIYKGGLVYSSSSERITAQKSSSSSSTFWEIGGDFVAFTTSNKTNKMKISIIIS